MYYAFMASKGEEGYKEKMKDVVTKVQKEDVIDVLLKLDVLTLHAITGPIHMIDALTGWHIGPMVKAAVLKIDDRAKKALEHLNVLKNKTMGATQKRIGKFLNQLKQIFKQSDQISTEVLKGLNDEI